MGLAPATEAELADLVRAAAAQSAPIEVVGGGTRRGLGRPVQAAQTLTTAQLRGLTLYEPGALTLVAAAGTPVSDVEAALQAENQRLPFEPMDHRRLMGTTGEPTIGGVVSCNLSGPRRVQAGACRDSLIGVRFVTGEGVAVKNGGRVMKNVTGYDLVKLMCGAYGVLGVLTEVAFKVLPTPETAATLRLDGLDDARAIGALSAALGSPFEVTGAAHLPNAPGSPATLLRLEGLAASVAYRTDRLRALLADAYGAGGIVDDPAAVADIWRAVRDVEAFADRPGAVWRISLRPSHAAGVVATLREKLRIEGVQYDWGGGLVWLLTPETGDAGAEILRAEIDAVGGHATLIRASDTLRAAIPVFHPEAPRLAAVSAELKRKFDPSGVLNPGRMWP